MAVLLLARVVNILVWCTFLHMGKVAIAAEYDDFDFDGLPGVQHEFKIEVPAGGEECFHQKVAEGANLHMSFEVLRSGSERLIDIVVKDPTSYIVEAHYAKSEVLNSQSEEMNVFVKDPDDEIDHVNSVYGQNKGKIAKSVEIEGVYTICLDNQFSRMASKLVYVYLITFVPAEWTKYVQEIEDMNMAVSNFTHSISIVQKSLEEAKLHQASSRMNVVKDWYLILGNNSFIVKWSIAQICVVIFSSVFTVYFVRRLFKIPNVTPSQKPRA